MRRQQVTEHSPTLGREMNMIAYGDRGLPVLVFPSSEGKAADYEGFGMIKAVAPLLESGKLRLYCVDSYDSESWYAKHRPPQDRAWRHSLYDDWVMNTAVPAIGRDVGDPGVQLTTTGCSFGAYHAANFALKHPNRFNHALCLSGVYDARFLLGDYHDEWVYFNNPMEFVAHMSGDLLDEVRENVFISLICGQGNYEERCLDSTKEFWSLLSSKGIPNYMDLWGHDVAHDWPWWRAQLKYLMSHLVEGRMPWPSTSLV